MPQIVLSPTLLAKLDLQPLDGRPGPSNGNGSIYLRLERIDDAAEARVDFVNANALATQPRLETPHSGNEAHLASPNPDLYSACIFSSGTRRISTERWSWNRPTLK